MASWRCRRHRSQPHRAPPAPPSAARRGGPQTFGDRRRQRRKIGTGATIGPRWRGGWHIAVRGSGGGGGGGGGGARPAADPVVQEGGMAAIAGRRRTICSLRRADWPWRRRLCSRRRAHWAWRLGRRGAPSVAPAPLAWRWRCRDGRGLGAAAIRGCRRQRRQWRASPAPSRRQRGWQPRAALVRAGDKRGPPAGDGGLAAPTEDGALLADAAANGGESRLGSYGGLGQRHLLDGAMPSAEQRTFFSGGARPCGRP